MNKSVEIIFFYIYNMQQEVFEELVLLKFTVEILSLKQFFCIFSYETAQVRYSYLPYYILG